MSLALKIASLIVGLKDLNHRYYEDRDALSQIFDALRAEMQGNAVETSTLGDSLRQWLFRNGFENDTEIAELVKVNGTTIGKVVHMLICVLNDLKPRNPHEKHGIKAAARPRKTRVYPVENMRAVKELCDQKRQRLKQRLSGKGKDVQKEVNTHVEDPDLEARGTFGILYEEEVLEMLEDGICSGQSNVSEAEETNPVNTELEPDEPLDEELPLEISIRPPPKPPSFEQSYQKFQPESREILGVVLTKVGRILTTGTTNTSTR